MLGEVEEAWRLLPVVVVVVPLHHQG